MPNLSSSKLGVSRTSHPTPQTHALTATLALVLMLSSTACTEADSNPDDSACPTGGCTCEFDFDCADPIAQYCNDAGRCVDRTDASVDPLDATSAGDGSLDGEEEDRTVPTPDVIDSDDPEAEVEPDVPDAETGTPDETAPDADPDETSDVVPDEDAEATDTTEVPMEDHWVAYTQTLVTIQTEIHFIKSDGTGEVLYEHEPADIFAKEPAWSRDGMQLALNVIRSDGHPAIRVIDFENETSQDYLPGLLSLGRPTWFPDGARILVTGKKAEEDVNTLWVLDLDSDTLVGAAPLIADAGLNDSVSHISADGTRVVLKRGIAGDGFRLYEWSDDAGVDRLDHVPNISGAFDWTLDGSRLIYASEAPAVFSVPFDGGRAISYNASSWDLAAGGRPSGAMNPAYFPEGRRFVASTFYTTDSRPELVVVNAETGELILQLTNDDKVQLEAAVSPALAADIDISALNRLTED